jgi:hypothetical protein
MLVFRRENHPGAGIIPVNPEDVIRSKQSAPGHLLAGTVSLYFGSFRSAQGLQPFMDNGTTTHLTAPDPELEALSFALSDPESVGEWIGRLPMANVSESAGQIRQATFEIARLNTDWPTRMALLEGIRPTILHLSSRLDRAATGAGNQADGIARLAQRLQSNLSSGYTAVILDAMDLADEDSRIRQTVSLAIHRAISDLSRTLLRTLQYYVAPDDQLWLKLNQLYLVAERLGIEDEVHEDREGNDTIALSIRGAYLRSLLLAMAQPYQLRHRQLSQVFRALGNWVERVTLPRPNQDTIFLVDLGSNRGPAFKDRLKDGEDLRGIRSEVLAYELNGYLQKQDTSIAIPRDSDDALIHHLVEAWGEVKVRKFGRSETAAPMKVCVGLRATHYFLSGGVRFSEILGSRKDDRRLEINPFLADEVRFVENEADARSDVWDVAFDVGPRIPENPMYADPVPERFPATSTAESKETYQHYDTTAADTSPGGYRLRWNEPYPGNLLTGEVIGLRDETDPRWCLAVVRWIRQDDTGPYMGVELIAPRATPIAVRLIQSKGGKGGKGEYQRAFHLPELKPIRQPSSLITPASPFQPGQKIHFMDNGTLITAQLGDCLFKTESFNQFTFRVLDGYLENPQTDRNMGSTSQINKHTISGFR